MPAWPRARCDRRMELRAAFLACGSLAAPQAGYHLEFVAPNAPAAERIARLIRAEGIEPRTMTRKGRPVTYLKGLDSIVVVLHGDRRARRGLTPRGRCARSKKPRIASIAW